MRHVLFTIATVVALILPLGAVQANETRDLTGFFLHHDDLGDNTCGGAQYMDLSRTNADVGCTSTVRIMNEVFQDEDLFPAAEGLPLKLDALADVFGQITVRHGQGVSDFDLHIAVVGTPQGSFIPVTLGSETVHMTGYGTQTTEHEFSFDVDDALDGTVLTSLSVELRRTSSVAVLGGGFVLNGKSFVAVGQILDAG